jgi:hypothetical protein
MKFRDSHQGTDIFGISGDSFPDYFHFSVMALHFSIMALEGLIVILLTCGEVPVALGHLLLKLSLAQGQFFQDPFNAVQPIVAIRHVRSSVSSVSRRPSYEAGLVKETRGLSPPRERPLLGFRPYALSSIKQKPKGRQTNRP